MSSAAYNFTVLMVGILALTTQLNPALCGSSNKNNNMATGRTTIVQLFEWRWADIANECENFLGPNGYGAVQTSPFSENTEIWDPPRPWYERYYPASYVIGTRSGSEDEFVDMVQRCNVANVRIYVEGVFNDMTSIPGNGTAGSEYNVSTKSFGAVPYTSDDFHDNSSCASHNYGDIYYVKNCGSMDLDQSKPNVQDKIITNLNKMIGMGVAGFFLSTAGLMWPNDIAVIVDSLDDLPTSIFPAGAKPYIYQEVNDMFSEAIHYYDYTVIGDVTEFEYACQLANFFRNKIPMGYLYNWGKGWGLVPSGDAVVFIDDPVTQRGSGPCSMNTITFFEPRIYKMANAFMLAYPYGNPRVMSSYRWERDFENGHDVNNWIGPPHDSNYKTLPVTFSANMSCQGDWVCEHRWPEIYNMVRFRNVVDGSPLENWWDNGGYQFAFSRGNKGFLIINNKLNADLNQSLQTGLPAGSYCDVISGNLENGACTGHTVTVNVDGTVSFSISHTADDPMVAIHVEAKL